MATSLMNGMVTGAIPVTIPYSKYDFLRKKIVFKHIVSLSF